MGITTYIAVFVATFATIIILDFLWLGIITKEFIKQQFGSLITLDPSGGIKVNLVMGLIAWVAIALTVVLFVVMPATSLQNAAMMGAILGFLMYVMYDFTNLTFFNGYPLKFALVDVVWGTFLLSAMSTTGYLTKVIMGA